VIAGATQRETPVGHSGGVPGLWRRVVARVRSWIEIPYGYEDESGFHYGPAPTPEWAKKRNSHATPVLTDRASSVIQYAEATAPVVVAASDKVIAPSDSVSAA
jgi:hypothetical protein